MIGTSLSLIKMHYLEIDNYYIYPRKNGVSDSLKISHIFSTEHKPLQVRIVLQNVEEKSLLIAVKSCLGVSYDLLRALDRGNKR